MDSSPPTTLAWRFGHVVIVLMQQLGGIFLRDRSARPAVLVAQERLRSLTMRLRNLLDRIDAGTVRAPRPGRPTRERRPRPATAPDAIRPPRYFGWVTRDDGTEKWHVRDATRQVALALNDTAMLEALARAPRQAGRIVRPLCHALGLDVPESLRLPPRPKRAPKPRAAQKAKRKGPPRTRRVASALWPKHVVGPGETVPLRPGRRRSG